ncbi:MAG: class I SAM-dependent methyltransferase [Caldilineaceae bacterium]|nr:class I SAM-dependent methyltransferase [Caldilineaceae bacterium]
MGFYDDEDNVESYVKMAEGYDGRELVAALRQHLPPGATVLELGMGPGKDLALLAEAFTTTDSDHSEIFLRRYRRDHPDADVLVLDAVTLETERCFDAIFSNKVLHHLSVDELRKSLHLQAARLNADGLLLHSFWYGEGTEEHHGLRFTYHTDASLMAIVDSEFEKVACVRYTEIDEGDSLYLLLRRSSQAQSLPSTDAS